MSGLIVFQNDDGQPKFYVRGYVTAGDVRGYGRVRTSRALAEADLRQDRDGCAAQGGYSDREVYAVDEEGYLRDDNGQQVYIGSPTNGAARI